MELGLIRKGAALAAALVLVHCSATKPEVSSSTTGQGAPAAGTAAEGAVLDIPALCPAGPPAEAAGMTNVDKIIDEAGEKAYFLKDDEAFCLLSRAFEIAPESPSIHVTVAYLLLLNGRVEEAELANQRALALDDPGGEAHEIATDFARIMALLKSKAVTLEELRGMRPKPPEEKVNEFYGDDDGHTPLPAEFDAAPGALCGNGRSLYWTTYPRRKPVPEGWVPPPPPGSDSAYPGPDPLAPVKESPNAAPTPRKVLAAPAIVDVKEAGLLKALEQALPGDARVGVVSDRLEGSVLTGLEATLVPLDRGLLDGTDDKKAARQLEKKKLSHLLVDRTALSVQPWLDDDAKTLKVRLRDGLETGWFHPVVLGSGWALYRVAPKVALSRKDKQRLSDRIREKLQGKEPGKLAIRLSEGATDGSDYRVAISLRKRNEPALKGRKAMKRGAAARTVTEAVDAAADRLINGWEDARASIKEAYDLSLPVDLTAAIEEMEIEVDLFYDICTLTDRRSARLSSYMDRGLDGLMVEWRGGGATPAYLEPSYPLDFELQSEEAFLLRLLAKHGLNQFLRKPDSSGDEQVVDEVTWMAGGGHELRRFKSLHWIERPAGEKRDIAELYRGVPLKERSGVTPRALRESLTAGADWLVRHQKEDGRYAYKYLPNNKPEKRWFASNNIARHAIIPVSLLAVNRVAPDPKLVSSAKRGIEHTLRFLRLRGDRCVICHRDPPAAYYNAKMGAVAATIMSILELKKVADIAPYADALRCLSEELLFMQDQNGHFRQFDVPGDHPYYGAESTLASGELMLALARLYADGKDERFLHSFDRARDYYMKQWRALRSERASNGKYDEERRIFLTEMLPWLVGAMTAMYRATGNAEYGSVAVEVQGWAEEELYIADRRARYPDLVGGYFDTPSTLPTVESCHAAWSAASVYKVPGTGGRSTPARRENLIESLRFCLQLQFDDYATSYYLPVAEEARGGYRQALDKNQLRTDYSYFALVAMAEAYEVLGFHGSSLP